MTNKNHIVVSGVNLVEGGTLKIFKDCLDELSKNYSTNYKITALVHNSELFTTKNIKFLEFENIKKSWIRRIFFEYIECYFLSKKLNADVWLAMHDMTPNVVSKKQYVYCHNAMCFYEMKVKEFIKEPKLYLFSKFYKYIYKINIKKNKSIITQQNWIKKEFQNTLKVNNVITAYPFHKEKLANQKIKKGNIFLYPALSRFFKNHETLLEAWSILQIENPDLDAELYLTIDGTENKYSNTIISKYSNLKNVHFLGKISFEETQKLYEKSHCLIFPSNLETWGLPLSEAQSYGLSIIASDLPYARENIGNYELASFFPKNDYLSLSQKIKSFIDGSLEYNKLNYADNVDFKNWDELLKTILSQHD